MNIGKAIQTLRTKKNITQKELAEKIGITQTGLSYIETGVKHPSENSLEKIANALGSSVAFIKLASLDLDKDVPQDKRAEFDELFPDFVATMQRLLIN
ncbi:helix-turn-helix domain-containing protein [Chitinophaga pinensis]|uniref:Transcriptional regulator, XRE family n=1 Tax=Chitinophaga pinensis (strain ATCC 43595 / DSM 2588 / LMG 13176 / NBRC 15968 / NCIMB 11800 / UQM 2034) TaxID=485918 RepID=A0A979G521_CHIPD|nr:helix-turn-helix transcriptional regulator [Chitinophaga pinensis]ACU60969.1 transcriptional regulator, XRE family [Chitinophaga pinensis DSM 2588]